MFNRKLFMSLLTVGIFATVAYGSTWAYFSDSATTADNSIKAGTLELDLENGPPTEETGNVTFRATGVQPGDTDVLVKTIRVLNKGSLDGKVTAIAANGRDSYGLGRYLIIKINDQTIYDCGTPVENVIVTELRGGYHTTPEITYTFVDNGDQNEVQGDTFFCDIVFTLKQELAP
jgi:predicted ribosomally synthesized peptide with SipW-like signal peptide